MSEEIGGENQNKKTEENAESEATITSASIETPTTADTTTAATETTTTTTPVTSEDVIHGTKFELDPKYKILKPIGHGAYGVVVAALNTETNDKVAVKKVPDAFDDIVDAKRILREIKLLKHFDHENIIGLLDILPPPSLSEFNHVYMITDLMETDLYRIIYSKQPLSDDHVQYFIYQILRALKYIHSAEVLHRDLKPSNILLNSNCDLKICDFGLARGLQPEEDKIELTEYVVTRWYRAPEIMLSCQEYTKAIDVWSVGCIFAELLGRQPLFPGKDYIHQLQLICHKLGTPTDEELEFVTSERAKRFIKTLPKKTKVSFALRYPNANPQAIDLLEKMLVFNPTHRITVEEALAHPYLESLHNPDDEPVGKHIFSFSFEKETLTKPRLQELIFEELCSFHPDAKEKENRRQQMKKHEDHSNSNQSDNENNKTTIFQMSPNKVQVLPLSPNAVTSSSVTN